LQGMPRRASGMPDPCCSLVWTSDALLRLRTRFLLSLCSPVEARAWSSPLRNCSAAHGRCRRGDGAGRGHSLSPRCWSPTWSPPGGSDALGFTAADAHRCAIPPVDPARDRRLPPGAGQGMLSTRSPSTPPGGGPSTR
jgi:hypothetical protein